MWSKTIVVPRWIIVLIMCGLTSMILFNIYNFSQTWYTGKCWDKKFYVNTMQWETSNLKTCNKRTETIHQILRPFSISVWIY